MSATLTKPPSPWQIEEALRIAAEFLATADIPEPTEAPDEGSNYEPSDASLLLDALKARGADLGRIMEKLLLAADEAGAEAELCKQRQHQMARRGAQRTGFELACRNAALHIMRHFPELFPPDPRSKALAKFHSSVVDARVQPGKPGVKLNVDPAALEPRFQRVKVDANLTALREAVLTDGEVIDGVEEIVSDPFLVLKVA